MGKIDSVLEFNLKMERSIRASLSETCFARTDRYRGPTSGSVQVSPEARRPFLPSTEIAAPVLTR